MSILKVTNLTKTFGSGKKAFTAVDNISFGLKEGEILGLLGPNGAGKTTTIQMLLGVLTPTFGEISFFGKLFEKHREEILEKVNFSSTYTNLPWHLTARENLIYTSYLYDIPDRDKRVNEMIVQFRLEKLKNQALNDLSAGQLTRVNLAKAFINKPQVLLLDEPTASLDPETAHFIREYILDQRTEQNISIIFTSHNMYEVEDICDRVLIIKEGKILADDIPSNLSKTIKTSTVSFYFDDANQESFIDYCIEKDILHNLIRKNISVQIPERDIPKFLGGMIKRNIHFIEISIDKPTLHDYFIQMASEDGKDENNRLETII
ncbi:MAG: ABC-type multidrug transport system, ATPase component [Candidatus Roizmanbacteria bacterium GW2011_GWA2_37_7]|uniref:ABC-type multidrug transport system, ATPase component n=1 Tax=Candidatus Roizmanbacteria bacterium GW2011_GWA2_37_7 TaxID=1618481 RepID=A0A0G0JMM2_9BACT|nr:MAG: ABC-type multidrug transport system, ATPase component [Candidatus Roizmanbacteria bacterium GW2011_GWA2_37_7]